MGECTKEKVTGVPEGALGGWTETPVDATSSGCEWGQRVIYGAIREKIWLSGTTFSLRITGQKNY